MGPTARRSLKAAGYEVPKGGGAHHHTIESLKLTISDDGTIVKPLQAFRAKRAGGNDETTGVASDAEVNELRLLAVNLRDQVIAWLKKEHSALL